MIKLLGDWVITANKYDYMLKRIYKNNRPKKSQTVEGTRSYHSTIQQALKYLLEKAKKSAIQKEELTLTEAIAKLDEIQDNFIKALSATDGKADDAAIEYIANLLSDEIEDEDDEDGEQNGN